MKLTSIIAQANSSELRGVSKKSLTTPDIIQFISLGMVEINKRFPLEFEEAIISMSSNKSLYKFDGSDPDVKKSDGTSLDPNEFMKITGLYEADGRDIFSKLNKTDDPLGVCTPSLKTIQVGSPIDNGFLSVIYAQSPKYLVNGSYVYGLLDPTTDPELVEVNLPLQLLEPLLHYVGYRVYSVVDNGDLNDTNNSHYLKFEASCKRVEENSVLNSDDLSGHVVTEGWA